MLKPLQTEKFIKEFTYGKSIVKTVNGKKGNYSQYRRETPPPSKANERSSSDLETAKKFVT